MSTYLLPLFTTTRAKMCVVYHKSIAVHRPEWHTFGIDDAHMDSLNKVGEA
ncbi:AAEL009315-PA [Aedes aegypti]|uniref:AAEL009315-PA n=1 Tax=Aedes aegypti TaxID=7159 RepID=Q16W71_AEDAE|nr:AAEL009315-PA [Aedes aegypti]